MKYAAVVLYNNKNSLSSVDFVPVTDALLSGGVFLSETAVLPYDDKDALIRTLTRMQDHAAVFLICDGFLVPAAKLALAEIASPEGDLFKKENCLYAVLPAGMGGAEAVKELMPKIDEQRGDSYFRVVLCTVGAPGEQLGKVAAQISANGLDIHVSEKYGAARIELIYDRNTPKYAVDEAVRFLAGEMGEYLYAVEDMTVARRLVEALKVRRYRISVAESFTGGGVGRAIVRIPGASAVYFEGLNTYDPAAKEQRLGVTPFTIKQRGTVSEQTAYEMAAGLLKTGNCDLAVATTGVAGPDPDEKGNPAGLCYIAVGTREQIQIYRYHLSGGREAVTETAINFALFLAYKAIK